MSNRLCKRTEYLESRISAKHHIRLILPYRSLCVRGHALLEEVVLAFQRHPLHERERIRGTVNLRITQLKKQAIGHELNVLAHELGVHANQLTGQRLGDELLLNLHGLADNLVSILLTQFVGQLGV